MMQLPLVSFRGWPPDPRIACHFCWYQATEANAPTCMYQLRYFPREHDSNGFNTVEVLWVCEVCAERLQALIYEEFPHLRPQSSRKPPTSYQYRSGDCVVPGGHGPNVAFRREKGSRGPYRCCQCELDAAASGPSTAP